MEKYKFNKALEIHDAIETLKTIQQEVLDHNRCVAVDLGDGEMIRLPGVLYERFRTWTESTREHLEREFERV